MADHKKWTLTTYIFEAMNEKLMIDEELKAARKDK